MTIDHISSHNRNKTGFGYMVIDIAAETTRFNIQVDAITTSCFTSGFEYRKINFIKRNWYSLVTNFKLNYFLRSIYNIKVDKPSLKMVLRYFLYHITTGFIKKILIKNEYDLIHIHGIGPATQPMIDLCEILNQKYLVTLHGLNSFSDSVNASNIVKEYERNLLRKAFKENTPITVISTGIKNTITNFLNIKEAVNVKVVSNGCDTTPLVHQEDFDIKKRYNINKDKKLAVCVGNIAERKNQIQVVRAFSLLPESVRSNLVILFLGNDYTNGVFKSEIKKFELENSLIICGNIPKDQVPFFYRQASFNIVASISEGFGLSIIESFVYGVPTVAYSDLDAIPDLYNKKAMLLVDNRTDNALAKGIENAFRREWKTGFIKEFSENFSFTKMAERYMTIYKKIIQAEK
jgi:glycosyltransferase involved in cell wall biosynthesis